MIRNIILKYSCYCVEKRVDHKVASQKQGDLLEIIAESVRVVGLD